MKARFVQSVLQSGYIEIMPDDHRFNSFDGHVEVRFVDLDIDTGYFVNKPRVNVNCSLRDMTPARAKEWSEIILTASMLAEGRFSPSWGESIWQAYKDYRASMLTTPSETSDPYRIARMALEKIESFEAENPEQENGYSMFQIAHDALVSLDALERQAYHDPESETVTFAAGTVEYSGMPVSGDDEDAFPF